MNLSEEIIIEILSEAPIRVRFDQKSLDVLTALINHKAIDALEKVRAAVTNEQLSDFDCVEEIVLILEELGSGGGFRHDFG